MSTFRHGLITEVAEKFQIAPRTAKSWLTRGIIDRETLELTKKLPTSKLDTVAVTKAAEEAGLNAGTVMSRVYKYGMSLEEALRKPVKKSGGIAARARKNGVTPAAAWARIHRGYPVDLAVSMPMKRMVQHDLSAEVQDEMYKYIYEYMRQNGCPASVTQVGERFNMNPSSAYARLNKMVRDGLVVKRGPKYYPQKKA